MTNARHQLTTEQKESLLYHYRRKRAYQLATYSKNGLFIDGVDQHQFTGGSAAYGFHAYSAYQSAKCLAHRLGEI